MGLIVRADAAPGVADDAVHARLDRLLLDAQVHIAPVGELDRIAEEVVQHLAKPRRIAHHPARQRHPVRDVEHQPLLLRACRIDAGDVIDLRAELEDLAAHHELAGLDARDVEQVVDQREQMDAGSLDQLDPVAGRRVELVEPQQPRDAEDAVQGRAQLVADVGEELRLHRALAQRELERILLLARQRLRLARETQRLGLAPVRTQGRRELHHHQQQQARTADPAGVAAAPGQREGGRHEHRHDVSGRGRKTDLQAEGGRA